MLTTRLAWAVIVLLATYLTFIGGGWLGIYSSALRIASVAMAGTGLVAWMAVWARHPDWRPRSVLWPAIVAALGSLAISTVFSRVPRMSLEYLGYAVLLVALYLLLVRLMAHPFFARRLLVLGAMFFPAICAAFLVLVAKHWLDWWTILGRIAIPPLRPNFEGLTYLNPSAVLTVAGLFAVPAFALANPSTRAGRAVIGAIVVVLGLVAFLTGSRAGWLAIALTMLVGAIAAGVDPAVRTGVRTAARAALADRRARAATTIVLVGGLASLVLFAPAIARRVGESGEQTRTQYAIAAIRMFEGAPVVGNGPGTWVIQRQAVTEADEPDFVIPHAHNLEVQTLAELGVVGGAAGLVLVVTLGLLVVRSMRDRDRFRRRLGWLTFLGLAYFAFHQLLDFYANLPAALFAAVLPVAYLDATSSKIDPPDVRQGVASRIAAVVLPLFTAVAVIALLLVEAPATKAERAVQLADRGQWAAAEADARAAADLDPDIGSYAMVAGLTAARAGDHVSAVIYFERVAEAADLPEAWVDLAAEQLALGAAAEARTSLARAFRLGQQRAALSLAVGDLAVRADDADLAVNAFASVLERQPTVAADPWWSATPDRVDARNEAIARLHDSASTSVRWRLAMATNDFENAHATAANEPDRAFIDLVIDSWGAQEPSIERLIAECYASPLDATRLTLCAKVAGHLDRASWLADMRDLLEVLQPDLSNDAGEIVIADAPAATDRLAGRTVPFWGVFTYRRPVPRNLIVRGVATLILR